MFVEMNPSNGGGGSAKSGTTPATSAGGTITIDTGLSQISQFVWFATAVSNNMQNLITYDSNMGNYFVGAVPANSGGYFKRAIGSLAVAGCPALTSINGGTVVITTATSYGNVQQGYWFAQ